MNSLLFLERVYVKMKTRFCFAVVVALLISAFALPILAEGELVLTVSHVRLTYVGRSSTGTDAVVGLVFIRDANNVRVAGASVTVEWMTPNGPVAQEAVTGSTGVAWLTVWEGQGDYTLVVTGVEKPGYTWDDLTPPGVVDAAITTVPWTRW